MSALFSRIFLSRAFGSILTFGLLIVVFLIFVENSTKKERQAGPIATLVIKNVTVIDAINGQRAAHSVYITDGEIIGVYPSGAEGTPALSDDAQKLDGSGRFLIPGLWDAHVHLTYDPLVGYETFFPLSLAHGITALRDTGGQISALEPAIAASGKADTPDLFYAGPLIDGDPHIYDGSSGGFPEIAVRTTTPADAAAHVDAFVDAGATFVKAYEMLTPETLRAVGKRAQERGVPVAGHVPLSVTVWDAVDAGVRDIQHMRNIEFDCSQNPESLLEARLEGLHAPGDLLPSQVRSKLHSEQRAIALPSYDPARCADVVAMLAEKQVFQTPTMVIMNFMTRRLFADLAWQQTFDLVTPETQEKWQAGAVRLSGIIKEGRDTAFPDWAASMLPMFEAAGVPVMAGTDAPIVYLTPGISLHEELAQLVDGGLSPMGALKAATYYPAKFLGLEGQRGTLAAGMKADMVLLSKNPLDDIRNTLSIKAVVKDGAVWQGDALTALKEKPSKLVSE